MNIWQNFYQNIRDPSWPDCVNETEFVKLPEHIQSEILTVYNGDEYLKLSDKDITYLPLTLSQTGELDENNFPLKFAVASDFFVFYNQSTEGGGIHFGQNYSRVIKYLYPDRIFEHCMEWAAGAGPIGFRLLADKICNNIHFVESNSAGINACLKTIGNMPERFNNTASVTQTTTLSNLDNNLMFDLVVANPPTFNYRKWPSTQHGNLSDSTWNEISFDKNWQAHQDFFKHIKKYLKSDGVILLQEQKTGSSVFEFEEFITAGGLKIVRAFVEQFDTNTWYLELTHSD
jgi:16S rRNA G966 N2-methylase RsmD